MDLRFVGTLHWATSRKSTTRAAGQRFQRHAQRLLGLQHQVKQKPGSASGGPMALRIGAIESVVHSRLSDWLQEMRRQQLSAGLHLRSISMVNVKRSEG